MLGDSRGLHLDDVSCPSKLGQNTNELKSTGGGGGSSNAENLCPSDPVADLDSKF